MTEVEPVLDFATSGRSGRRNALPDILGSPAGVNPGDLPLKLAELSVEGNRDYLSFSCFLYRYSIKAQDKLKLRSSCQMNFSVQI